MTTTHQSERAIHARKTSFANRKKLIDSEEWIPLNILSSPSSGFDDSLMSSDTGRVPFGSDLDYVGGLNYLQQVVARKAPSPLSAPPNLHTVSTSEAARAKVVAAFKSANSPINPYVLLAVVPYASRSLILSAFRSCGTYLRGNFVLSSVLWTDDDRRRLVRDTMITVLIDDGEVRRC